MNHKSRLFKVATGVGSALLAGWLLAACSQTTGSSPNAIQRATGETPAAPPPSGFLGSDYSLLQPASSGSVPGQKAALAYVNQNVNWTSYNKIIIAPVTYWADSNSTVSADQQQILCNYLYSILQKTLSQNFTVVTDPGPGTLRFAAALSDASSATPVLRTISVVVPQAHALNLIKYGLTGKYAFVGSASGEGKLTDSVSGQLLAAWADQQFGTAALKNADVWQWGDADNAMNYWAKGLDQRLVSLGVQQSGSAGAAG
ncbi:MAG: DUF3313 domain-containing protein [Deltaproteobacteria bacterium]|nr:DUF3313 domain-containing protein [Deltaproteobacteria bacterium]